jgi:hypothetical protein
MMVAATTIQGLREETRRVLTRVAEQRGPFFLARALGLSLTVLGELLEGRCYDEDLIRKAEKFIAERVS